MINAKEVKVSLRETVEHFFFDTKRDWYFTGSRKDLVSIVEETVRLNPLKLGSDPYHNPTGKYPEKFMKHGQPAAKVTLHLQVLKYENGVVAIEVQGFTPYKKSELGIRPAA